MAKFDAQKFLSWCQSQCKQHGVKLILGRGKSIRCNGYSVSGYFDAHNEGAPTLKVASKHKLWVEVLAHEICHMFQWIEKTEKSVRFDKVINTEEWLNGKNFPAKKLHTAIIATVEMERECEVNALKLLEKFGYKNRTGYIQRANAYTLFYFYMLETRKWCKKGRAPYNQRGIWTKFPKTFNINIHKTFKKLRNLYAACI